MVRAHIGKVDGYVGWSGGKDSTAALLLALEVDPNIPVVWFDSGLEYPDTHTYIQDVASLLNVNLTIIRAEPDALSILKDTGAWNHTSEMREMKSNVMHEALITTPSRKAHEKFGAGEVLGLRADESAGRLKLLAKGKGTYRRKDGSVVCCPIWRWDVSTLTGYLHDKGVPENPAYERLRWLGAPEQAQRVGLAVDGNGVMMGRLTWLRAGWPDYWEKLCVELPRLREWR